MSSTVTKLLTDFPNFIDQTQFYNEITADGIITTTLISVVISGSNVLITFASVLSAPELAELDAIIANHVPSQGGYPAFQPPPNSVTKLDGNTQYIIQSSIGSNIFSVGQNVLSSTVPLEFFKLSPNQVPAVSATDRSILYVNNTTGLLTQVEFGGASGPVSSNSANTGVGSGIFLGKTGSTLYFKSITGINGNISVASGPDTVNISVPFASTTSTGAIRIATQTEVNTGSSTDLAVAPNTLSSILSSYSPNLTTQTVSGTSTLSTTSLTDVLVGALTITPGAGTYLCIFSAMVKNLNNAASVTVSIYMNEIQITPSERVITDNKLVPMATNAITTVGAGQAIEIRWRVSGSSGEMTNRNFNIVRIGS